MWRHRDLLILLTAVPTLVPADTSAQSGHLAAGIAAMDAHDLYGALAPLEAAVREEPGSYAANWRLALTLVDIGNMTPSRTKSPVRDTLYAQAVRYARHAILAKPDGADGHFVLADALGHAALTKSAREKIKLATEIRNEALRAIAIEPRHDGAYHILGRWNAEVERLPGLEKFFAKSFLGAAVFDLASWDEAERNMKLAVQFAPGRIFHRLDLAQVLIDRAKWADARQQLDAISGMPVVDPLDASYKQKAATLNVAIAGKLRS